jgi:hypothetical protein
MKNAKDHAPNGGSNRQPFAPCFAGYLTKERLLSFPRHFYLVSNVANNPFNPALEIEVVEEVSREALWRMIVDWRLNGRKFAVFLDEESFKADKDERLKMARALMRAQ